MGASNFAEGVDLAFKVIFGISLFFLVGITITMLWFVYRYNRKRHPVAVQVKENNLLEITWITIPLILVMLMFYYGYVAFSPQRTVPKDAIPITVIGKMWSWTFEYEGGKQSPVLVVPLNKAVKLNLHSDDVIHSLYIPAFRIKEDVVPGKNNYMWFIAQQPGEYDVLCTVYCGLRHSYMETKARVVPEAEYAAWLKALPEKSADPEGLVILKKNACTGCHSIDGTKIVSASFKGLYGKQEKVVTGGKERSVTVDDAYIRTSIFDPDKDIVSGYQKGIMKPYKGMVTDEEATKIIDYLKSIK
ncbi:MAG TPA: cytochrome c oxidase subunit II [Bacteroidales bacterium]|nr:cytochrome c oxidase subunit II [Bacteroidales bacterium]